MTKKQKKNRNKIIISAILYVALFFVPFDGIVKILLYLIPYLIVGFTVLKKAGKNIISGRVFDENFLMCIATIGAFACGEYPEAVAVMLFYQVGELFQSIAVGKSRKSISELMDIRPEFATVIRDGEEVEVFPEEVEVGEEIVIKSGERVPLDGFVIDGTSVINTSALTGESMPRDVESGSEVISGCINISGVIKVNVTKIYENSTVARILDLVENASSKKSKAENFVTKFARYYTPAVVYLAVALAVIPPLFLGEWTMWIQRALAFLVVSCPCALVISIPLSFFSGIGTSSREGILVKGSNYLEALAETDTVIFDKTGTLSKGTFKVTKVVPIGMDEKEFLKITSLVENQSNHPISKSIVEEYKEILDLSQVRDVKELTGMGMSAMVYGKRTLVGNDRLMKENGIHTENQEAGTVVHVAVENTYCGYLTIEDEVKTNAKEALESLRKVGVKKIVMLTGDSKQVAEKVSAELKVDEFYSELLPEDKVITAEKILENTHGKVVFVGDGINDAPVLSRADIGIAMGAMGSDAAIEAADIVLMKDDLSKISKSVEIARRTLAIVRQNIIFALGVKFIVLILVALGATGMWAAVFADVGVSVIAILNARRV